MTTAAEKKRTHSRPCDACAVRRVRCDLGTSSTGKCTNCTNHEIQCTNIRVRQKSGPKKIQQKTRQNIMNLITKTPGPSAETHVTPVPSGSQSTTPTPAVTVIPTTLSTTGTRAFSLRQLLPYFEIYQKWFYGIWPVMSIHTSVAKLRRAPVGTISEALNANGPAEAFELVIAEDNAQEYALCCALCAMIARYQNFLKSTEAFLTLDNCPDASGYAQEARRIIFEYQLKSTPNAELLLTSFFLHKYHSNTLGEQQKGLIYLREAVSLAHILMMHDPETLMHQSPIQGHRHKKIYYLVLVTERFISFETNLPVLLEPTIPIPDQDLEEYPDLLYGFIALCRIFSATDKQFYVELHTKVLKTERTHNNMLQIPETNILQDFLQNHSNDLKKQWLSQLQQKLEHNIEHHQIASDAQKVNVMISKAWLQSLGWLIASENFLINPNAQSPPLDDCFSVRFPLKIAQDFLTHVSGLPDFAFESNGPDVSVKLLEIADSLYNFTIMSTDPNDTSLAYNQLQTIYDMVQRYKANLDLPRALFSKISGLLESKRLRESRGMSNGNPAMELFEDEDDMSVIEERAQMRLRSLSPENRVFGIHGSSTSSMASSHGARTESVSSMDHDVNVKVELQDVSLPPIHTGYTPSGYTPSGFTPSGFLNTAMSPSGGMLQKTPSSIVLSQMGASLSPFYIPGTLN